MRKHYLTLLLMALFTTSAFAQQKIISGSVKDTTENKNLQNAVVAFISKTDSTLAGFVRTGPNGDFKINTLLPGQYILMVTYPKYADYTDTINATESADIKLGVVPLMPVSKLLEEVVIRQNKAIRIKGDTIEYTADSFHVQDGANVKELLKRLPGLEVDREGKIKAQGKTVEKVLVDGEEFFTDDPAVVTENLRADAIDKVQVYDKKSDQAEFTGIDDGKQSRTVNLTLKDGKKKGYFGKIGVGLGNEKRYNHEAMLNYFKGKKKISAYGILSNTGKTGLGWEDRGKFGSGNDWGDAEVEMGAGYISISSSDDGAGDDFFDWENQYSGEGIPKTIKAGAHFSNKWNLDKNTINGNYTFKQQDNGAEGGSLSKFILPDSAYYSQENHKIKSFQNQHMLVGFYDIKIDSLSSVRIRLNGLHSSSYNFQNTNSGVNDENFNKVNTNLRTNESNTNKGIFYGSVLWKKKFLKPKRTLSLNLSHKYSDSKSTGYLNSLTDFYDEAGIVYKKDTIDQFKENTAVGLSTASRLVYTEPIGKKSTLEFNYSFARNINTSDRKSFDKTIAGKYESLNQLFSNNNKLQYISNTIGARYQYNNKKTTFNIGSGIGKANSKQKDSAGSLINNLKFVTLSPNARLSYTFNPQKNLRLNYSGNTSPPSINQIQPIRQNEDPLNITVGNPLLKQSFTNNVSLGYNSYKILTGTSVWIWSNYSTTSNAIVSDQTIEAGKTTNRYVNSNGISNFSFNGDYGFEIKKISLNLGIGANLSGGTYINFINQNKNINKTLTTGLNLNIRQYKDEKYDFYIRSGINRNNSVSSINANKNIFWTQNHSASFNISVKKKFRVGSDINYDVRQKTDAFQGKNNIAYWTANMSYKVFKKNNGIIRFDAYDILNQQKGFERFFSSNYQIEKTYQVLQRYFMLTFTWNFTKNPGTLK